RNVTGVQTCALPILIRYGENSKRAEPVALPLSVIRPQVPDPVPGVPLRLHAALQDSALADSSTSPECSPVSGAFPDDGRSCRSRLSRSGIHCAGILAAVFRERSVR